MGITLDPTKNPRIMFVLGLIPLSVIDRRINDIGFRLQTPRINITRFIEGA